MMIAARQLEQSWLRVRRLAKRFPDQWGGEDLLGVDPLRIFGGTRSPHRVLVVSSEAALKRWNRSDWPPDLVVVLVAGMVSEAQASIIGAVAAKSPLPIGYIGDASPMGLHTYFSLQHHLSARRIRFCGVCDELLSMLGQGVPPPERLTTWDHSAFDRAHLRVVASLADPEQVLGPLVAAVVRSGRTIPVAALSYRAGLIQAMFEAALTRAARKKGGRHESGGLARPRSSRGPR
jgi:hypothetical protein